MSRPLRQARSELRNGGRSRREESQPQPGNWPTHRILGAFALTVGALLFFSVVGGEGGVVTEVARRLLRQAFGLGAVLLPLVMVGFGLLAMIERGALPLGRVVICLACLFLVFVGVAQLQAPPAPEAPEFASYYLWHYGGFLGAGLVFLLRNGFGQIGAYIVLAGILLVGLVIVSERPLSWHLALGGRALWLALKATHSKLSEFVARPWEAPQEIKAKRKVRPRPQVRPLPPAAPEPVEPPPAPVAQAEEGILPSAPAKDRAGAFALPPLQMLSAAEPEQDEMLKEEVEANIVLLEETLASFGIPARVVHHERGPVITRYEVDLAPGIRVNRVANLADDLARAVAAVQVRVEAPVPGKSVVGIEVPNKSISFVSMRSVLESNEFKSTDSLLKFALGKDIAGHPMVGDLGRMPHLLIGGATNSGKSVCLNSVIASLLFNATPKEVRLILIDPKRVELSLYEDIPHLIAPIIHDAREASYVLRQALKEMERRYRVFSPLNVKNIAEYNRKAPEINRDPLPCIVIVIDELADLMMQAHNEFEKLICRLAQLARATGIHLVVATQRPTTDIITGTIKANIPSRIAFAVSSQVDSRTILDCNGAERLIGSGDMLFLPLDAPKPVRIQGAFISSGETEALVRYLREQGEPEYAFEPPPPDEEPEAERIDIDVPDEEFMPEAIEIIKHRSEVSVSLFQRKLRIGFNRAARLVEIMEEKGFVGPADGVKPRKVLYGLPPPLPMPSDGEDDPGVG